MKGQALRKKTNYDGLAALLAKKDKSPHDCESIYNYVESVKGFQSFIESFLKGLKKEQIAHLCSKFEYKKYLKGDILFRQGDKHDNRLYIVLQGSVIIFINRALDVGEETQQPTKKETLASKTTVKDQEQAAASNQSPASLSTPAKPLSFSLMAKLKSFGKNALVFSNMKAKNGMQLSSPFITSEEKESLMLKYGGTTRLLGSGKYFGEKALLTNDRRSATIVVDQHMSEIITLEKKYFQEYLHHLIGVLTRRKEIVTVIFPEIATYTASKLDNLLYCFSPETFYKGTHICIEGHREEKVYIIQDGEVEIHKATSAYSRRQKVCIISTGSVVGEEIFLNDKYCFKYTCTVLSPTAVILVGDKKSIDAKFPSKFKNILLENWTLKEQSRSAFLREELPEPSKPTSLCEFPSTSSINPGYSPLIQDSQRSTLPGGNTSAHHSHPSTANHSSTNIINTSSNVFHPTIPSPQVSIVQSGSSLNTTLNEMVFFDFGNNPLPTSKHKTSSYSKPKLPQFPFKSDVSHRYLSFLKLQNQSNKSLFSASILSDEYNKKQLDQPPSTQSQEFIKQSMLSYLPSYPSLQALSSPKEQQLQQLVDRQMRPSIDLEDSPSMKPLTSPTLFSKRFKEIASPTKPCLNDSSLQQENTIPLNVYSSPVFSVKGTTYNNNSKNILNKYSCASPVNSQSPTKIFKQPQLENQQKQNPPSSPQIYEIQPYSISLTQTPAKLQILDDSNKNSAKQNGSHYFLDTPFTEFAETQNSLLNQLQASRIHRSRNSFQQLLSPSSFPSRPFKNRSLQKSSIQLSPMEIIEHVDIISRSHNQQQYQQQTLPPYQSVSLLKPKSESDLLFIAETETFPLSQTTSHLKSSMHSIRLKQFKEKRQSLYNGTKKASTLHHLSSPNLEMLVNTNIKSFPLKKQ